MIFFVYFQYVRNLLWHVFNKVYIRYKKENYYTGFLNYVLGRAIDRFVLLIA